MSDDLRALGQKPWFKRLTPLQRVIFAVCWTAAQNIRDERDAQREWERGMQEAIYGRP